MTSRICNSKPWTLATLLILLSTIAFLAAHNDSTRQALLHYILPTLGGMTLLSICYFYRSKLFPCWSCCKDAHPPVVISPLPSTLIPHESSQQCCSNKQKKDLESKSNHTDPSASASTSSISAEPSNHTVISSLPDWLQGPSIGLKHSFDIIQDHVAHLINGGHGGHGGHGNGSRPTSRDKSIAACRRLDLKPDQPLPLPAPGIMPHTVPIQDLEKGNGTTNGDVVDMSGTFVLVHSHNFDEFLQSQGVPSLIRKAVKMSKPVHTLTHVGNSIRIQVDGVTKGDVTYHIGGEPQESKIRHLCFLDHVTYLEEGDGIQIRKVCTSKVKSKNGASALIVTRRIVEDGSQMILSTVAVFAEGSDKESVESVQTFQRCC